MADAFVLPADLDLKLTDSAFSLNHPADVTLNQTLGRAIEKIQCGGDLTLDCGPVNGTLHANGVVHITGDFDGDTIFGREVHLLGDNINARAISASERIVIGAAKLRVDVILAPEIELDKQARGRVTVIECHGDLPPSRVRGGYTLEEYEEDFGNSAEFLAERGVAPLGEAAEPPVIPELDEDFGTDEAFDMGEDVEASEEVDEPIADTVSDELDEDGEDDEPIALNGDDLTPIEDDEDELYIKLSDSLERIVSNYEASELPEPVAQLQSFISQRDYDGLRNSITDVWTGLLSYHQQRGIRPHHQVTHAFNVIHGLVSEA